MGIISNQADSMLCEAVFPFICSKLTGHYGSSSVLSAVSNCISVRTLGLILLEPCDTLCLNYLSSSLTFPFSDTSILMLLSVSVTRPRSLNSITILFFSMTFFFAICCSDSCSVIAFDCGHDIFCHVSHSRLPSICYTVFVRMDRGHSQVHSLLGRLSINCFIIIIIIMFISFPILQVQSLSQ